jgi:uncharacterized DUF497 family protein
MHYRFEWDATKARTNVAKHGVTFDEARSVFVDRWAIEAYDWGHSLHEERLLITGMSDHNRGSWSRLPFAILRLFESSVRDERNRMKNML